MQVEKIAELKGHRAAVYALSEGPLPHLVLSGGSDQYLVQWDIDNPAEAEAIAKLPGIIYSICYLPDMKEVLVGEVHGGVHLIDVEHKTLLKNVKIHKSPVFAIKQLPGGKLFVSVSGDGTVAISQIADLTIVKKLRLCDEKVRGIAIHPNEKEMAVACGDGTIRIISLLDYKETHRIPAHEHSVYAIAYNPRTRVLLSGGRDAHLNLWDTDNKYSLLQSVPAHNFAIYDIQFSADGGFFATASRDKTFKIWDAEADRVLTRISKNNQNGHFNSVNALYWNPHTNYIVSAGDDKSLMVWKVEL